jgi:hypothetical protein
MNMNSENTRGKKRIPFRPGALAQEVRHELVGHLRKRLHPVRNQRPAARRKDHEGGNQGDRDRHEQPGIGESEIDPAEISEADEIVDRELVDRIDAIGRCCLFHAPKPLNARARAG